MKHYLTLEKRGYKFVCSIPSQADEKPEVKVEVFKREQLRAEFAVPLGRMPSSTGVDMADTIQLQWAIDRFCERGTRRISRGTSRRVR